MAGNARVPGVTVTSRVVAVLGAFDHEHRRLPLTALARRAGLPVSTTHRLAGELVAHGLLARHEHGEYLVGRGMWDLGLLAEVQGSLREAASPFLHDVHAATRATVHLAVRDDAEVLYLERLSGTASVEIVSTVGSRLPMHATGVGKVLLAHAPEDVRSRVMADLVAVTPHTVTDPTRLAAQLRRVRAVGWASTAQEMSPGACSLAVPVRRQGEVVAALGVVVAGLRRDPGRLVTALEVAARGIGRRL